MRTRKRAKALANQTANKSREPVGRKSFLKRLGRSRTLEILGPEWFAGIRAKKVPGKVIWCNFGLARSLGFDVPPMNRMTPDLHEQLIDALAYKALQPGEAAEARRTITLYADKYGGDGVVPALGAGRAAFTAYGNLCLKGIGFTPLFKHNDPDDFVHSHGCLPMREAILDAVFGELNANLFSKGTTRILAIIDLQEYLIDPKGLKIPRVLVARVGRQLRPGHLLAKRIEHESHIAVFARMTRDSRQLSTQTSTHRRKDPGDEPLVDVRATMLRIIDGHAQTAAEQFRWRILHGALSPSNMEVSGSMIDLATQSSQPRTAPIFVLDYVESGFGSEHMERARALSAVYRSFRSKIPRSKRRALNAGSINFTREMDTRYSSHLQIQLLEAAGLKSVVAARIKADHPQLARRFMELLTKMAGLRNPGCIYIGKSPVEDVSVLDIFRLLRLYSQRFFEQPLADHKDYIRRCLKPIYKGNEFHRAKKRSIVEAMIPEFQDLYSELMTACKEYAKLYYGNAVTMAESIKARTAFENEPIALFYRRSLNRDIPAAIAEYRSTGNTRVFVELIDARVSASVRSVDALLFKRPWRRLADGVFETQTEIIDCLTYSVKAWNNHGQKRRLCVCFPVGKRGELYRTPVAGIADLTKAQLRRLRYRYTTDCWKSSHEAGARLGRNERGQLIMACEIKCSYPAAGRIQGDFYIKGPGNPSGRRHSGFPAYNPAYNFVVPDKQ